MHNGVKSKSYGKISLTSNKLETYLNLLNLTFKRQSLYTFWGNSLYTFDHVINFQEFNSTQQKFLNVSFVFESKSKGFLILKKYISSVK